MDIDKSKENIQPLRGGRNAAQLGQALQAQRDADAHRHRDHQRQEYESAIEGYEGPDPLEPWFNYIQWVEQSFPKHGHEGQIDKLIKDCLTKFENDERYSQDRRYLRLWIKYIDYCNNPLELYQLLYNRGIGTLCSELYRAWACYCEEAADYPKAEQVYVLGLKSNATPKEELEQAHMSFQIWYAQRQLHDDSPTKRKAASALAETRLALTTLRTVKRRNVATVPSQRTGENIQSSFPGTMKPSTESTHHPPRSNVMLNIYDENPGPSSLPTSHIPPSEQAASAPVQSLLQSCSTAENQKEVGMWSNAALKTDKYCISKKIPATPLPFTPYEDEGIILPSGHLPYCRDDLTTFKVPICVPDPPDPTKIPMYNKTEVYKETDNGLFEFSPEEIRARNYLTKNKNSNTDLKITKVEPESAPESDNNCHFNDLNIEFDIEKVITQSNSLLNAEDHNTCVAAGLPEGYLNCMKKEPENDDKVLADFNNSLMANLHNDSMTVNTKDAMKELNIYSGNDSLPVHVEPAPFEIHIDHSMTMAAAQVKSSNILKPDPYSRRNENLCDNYDNGVSSFVKNQNMYAPRQNIVPNATQQLDLDASSTEIFTFNVPSASTPYNNQFKKPQFVDSIKRPNIRNFNVADNGIADKPMQNNFALKDNVLKTNGEGFGAQDDNQAGVDGLYPIMETTEEYRSGSSSSGSNLTTRNAMFGYTTRESSTQPLSVINENTQDSNINQDPSYQHYVDAYGKKISNVVAKNTPSINQTRNFNYSDNDNKMHSMNQQTPLNNLHTQSTSPYHTLDHQYNKTPNNVNKFNIPRSIPQCYQNSNQPPATPGNNGYQVHVGYQNSSNINFSNSSYQTSHPQNSQAYQYPVYNTPQHNASSHLGYQSPSHPQTGFQSPSHVQAGYQSPQMQPGFQSPPQLQPGFQSPPHAQPGFQSPPHVQSGYQSPSHSHPAYQNPQQNYHNPQNFQQQSYANSQQNYNTSQHNYSLSQQLYSGAVQPQVYMNPPHSSPAVQSPTRASLPYSAMQSFQNPSSGHIQMNHSQSYQQHPYHNSPYQNQLNYSNSVNQSQQYHPSQVYSPSQANKTQTNNFNGNYQNDQMHQNFSIYRSPQNQSNNSQIQYPVHNASQSREEFSNLPSHQSNPLQHHLPQNMMQNEYNVNNGSMMSPMLRPKMNPAVQKNAYQSPTSKLRSVRHEVPNVATKSNSNTPTSIPGYSNQYLNFITSSNEPKPNANTPKFNNSPSITHKMHKNLYVSSPEQAQLPPQADMHINDDALQSSLSRKHSHSNNIIERNRDLSKRQLDFETRTEMSEDSRDSMGKESRITSQQLNSLNIETTQMDVDSENSTDCHTFKSNCSNTTISTEDIPRPATIDFPKVIDPFNSELCNSLLQYVKFPNKNHYKGYFEVKYVPKVQQNTVITIDQCKYSLEKQLGKGTFGCVFRAFDPTTQELIALKYQKPGHPWEYYICQEIKARIKDPFMLPGYMDIRAAYLGDNASVFASELSTYGSLLDVANKIKATTTKCIGEFIVMLMTSEMLSILHFLHKANIIHADIKPDNFLLMKIPQSVSRTPSLQLIDFGCAIDMSLFPKGTEFKKVISTDGFTCTEMRDGRPWTYQTDLYCLAGTVYVILMGNYMQIANRGGRWTVEKKWPRYMKSRIWDELFKTLLNVKDCDTIPDLLSLKEPIDNFLIHEEGNLSNQLRNFEHVLKSK